MLLYFGMGQCKGQIHELARKESSCTHQADSLCKGNRAMASRYGYFIHSYIAPVWTNKTMYIPYLWHKPGSWIHGSCPHYSSDLHLGLMPRCCILNTGGCLPGMVPPTECFAFSDQARWRLALHRPTSSNQSALSKQCPRQVGDSCIHNAAGHPISTDWCGAYYSFFHLPQWSHRYGIMQY